MYLLIKTDIFNSPSPKKICKEFYLFFMAPSYPIWYWNLEISFPGIFTSKRINSIAKYGNVFNIFIQDISISWQNLWYYCSRWCLLRNTKILFVPPFYNVSSLTKIIINNRQNCWLRILSSDWSFILNHLECW